MGACLQLSPTLTSLIRVVILFYFQMKFHNSGIVCKYLKNKGLENIMTHTYARRAYFSHHFAWNRPPTQAQWPHNPTAFHLQFESNRNSIWIKLKLYLNQMHYCIWIKLSLYLNQIEFAFESNWTHVSGEFNVRRAVIVTRSHATCYGQALPNGVPWLRNDVQMPKTRD